MTYDPQAWPEDSELQTEMKVLRAFISSEGGTVADMLDALGLPPDALGAHPTAEDSQEDSQDEVQDEVQEEAQEEAQDEMKEETQDEVIAPLLSVRQAGHGQLAGVEAAGDPPIPPCPKS